MAAEPVRNLTFEHIINVEPVETVAREPTDVLRFVNNLGSSFRKTYTLDKTVETAEIGYKYLRNLYNEVVFNGKDYKDKLPRFEGNMAFTGEEGGDTAAIIQKCQQVDLSADKIWCYVFRGSEGAKNVRSEIVPVMMKGDKEEEVLVDIPILTYKLFQACLSILICMTGQQAKVNPARLGANHVRACKIEAAAKEKNNWAIHTHSGMNFVAKFVYQTLKAKKQLPTLPPMEAFLALAYKMDDKTAATLGKPRVKCLFSLKALFQTTGMSAAEANEFSKKIRASEWGDSYTGLAESLAIAFANNMDKIMKNPVIPVAAGKGNNEHASSSADSLSNWFDN